MNAMQQSVSPDDAVRLAREIYGQKAQACSMPGEYDHNFHLTCADGRSLVLKVMHPSRAQPLIDMQCKALRHLAARAPSLLVPQVQLTRRNEPYTKAALSNGADYFVWLLNFIEGKVLANVRPHSAGLLENLGRMLGEMDGALQDFSHPAAMRELKWDLAKALWIREHLSCVDDRGRRSMVEQVLLRYEGEVVPLLPQLRKSVIYGDANDYNVLVYEGRVSLIDFGDMHHGLLISEPAIAAAYAILGESRPLAAAAALVRGFHLAFPLDEVELSVLFPLIAMRLAVSVVNSAQRKKLLPDDPYVTISEEPAWEALHRLAAIHPRFAHCVFRNACGLAPSPKAPGLVEWLTNNGRDAAPVLDRDLRIEPCHVLDLSVSSPLLGTDPQKLDMEEMTRTIWDEMRQRHATVGIGRYDEPRLLYTSPLFVTSSDPTEERRTIHLGIDLFVPSGSNVHAPFDGIIQTVADNQAPLDYGPVVILRHTTGETQEEFFTLYGHLSRESTSRLSIGQRIAKGEVFAQIGAIHENGGWPPHLHFQVIADLLDLDRNFPGVAAASERAVWKSLCPAPNLLFGIPAELFPEEMNFTETLARRRSLLGRNLGISYRNPLKIVRGWRQYLYDHTGRAYLDVYNNVPLVGHSHPRVVRAVQRQMSVLNTNTRYLHDHVVRYAQRLTEKLPHPLRVCYFVNSGSEANELALRLARTHTQSKDVMVLEHAYHGHTSTLIDISPYKFNGPGGQGRKPWVHVAPIPDDYRGIHRRGEADLGLRYARHVADILNLLREQGRGIAAYIAESMPSVAGQIVFPPGYLAEVYRQVRVAGGVCIADEVQTGFGRMGTHFWGFETQNVVPDIVVLGKPIANAFPLAAVITTPEIAASFDNGMEFFSTYGGNPVACAAGLAVLDVLEEEHLQENARGIGNRLLEELRKLQSRYPLMGDVRGSGLFLGLDLVRDRETREPAVEQASYIANRLRDLGILIGTDGPHHNVLKLRPPLIFSEADAELFLTKLDAVLQEDPAQPENLATDDGD